MHSLLKELAKKHDVTVYVSDDKLNNSIIDGVKVNYTDKISEASFDIIISHFQNTTESKRLARERNVPLVAVIHNNQNDYILNDIKHGDLLIYNSEWVKNHYHKQGIVLTPPIKKVNKIKYTRQNKVLLVNLLPEKGAELFFTLAKEMPDIKFLGVRGGYFKHKQIEESLPNLEIVNNTNDMDNIYSQTKVVLMPSIYESYGMVASEAAQIGIPAIAHPTEGLKENLGKSGIFIDRNNIEGYKEEIRKLFNDKNYYNKYSELAKERYKENVRNNRLKEVIQAIEDLV